MKFVLGFLWVFPITLLAWVLFCVPAYLLGQVEFVRWDRGTLAIEWMFNWNSWLVKFCGPRSWAGVTLGANVIDICFTNDAEWEHELEHVKQQYRCGCSFYIIYMLECVYLYLFTKENPYVANHFERAARKAAGQPNPVMKERNPWK
jgi:hypothetical protein